MPNLKDDNKIFGVHDIERYYSGKMTAHEMHLLEKAALEDPFLADALEGYAFTNTPVEDVAYLQKKLEEKEEQKVVPIPFWNKSIFKIAAIFIVMAISAALIYRLLQVAPNNIAKTDNKSEKENRKETPAVVPQSDTTVTSIAIEPKPFEKVTLKIKEKRQTPIKINKPVAARPSENALAYQKAIADKKEQQQLENIQQETERQTMLKARTMASPPPALESSVAGVSVEKEFKGKVIDANKKPVPYAIVSIKGINKGTQTDSEGNFTLSNADSTLNVVVNSVGFESYNGILKSGDANNIIALNTATQSLSEVVVTGYGTNSDYEKITPTVASLKNAKTADKNISFQDYIEQELDKLKTAGFYGKGKVKLAFDLNEQGKPINFLVEKEKCASCIEEAKKMLQGAPALKKKNKEKKVKATIYF